MSGWASVPESDDERAWKALWTESEERFYAHDVFSLGPLQSSAEPGLRAHTPLEAIVTADVQPRLPDGELQGAAGEVRASEREIRIFDDTRNSVIDVRPGLGSRSRTVYRHETEPIGALQRPRLAERWQVVDAGGALVAELLPREGTIASADGRTLGSLVGGVLDLVGDPGRLLDRRLALAAVVSAQLEYWFRK